MTELEKRASRMKWSPPATGSKERQEMPSSAFLSPSTRTFPYKVKIDDQWVVSEKGLRSAISVANFRGNSVISAKASKILEDLTSDKVEHGEGDILAHHGVLGMKWGVRRERETAYRQKLSNIKTGTSANQSDIKRFAYRDASLASRVGKESLNIISSMVVRDIFSGNISSYGSMSKSEIRKRVIDVAVKTASNVALKDALAKSASKRYSDSGKSQPTSKENKTTKEDIIQKAVVIGTKAFPLAAMGVLSYKSILRHERGEDQIRVNKWGANIFDKPIGDFVGTTIDGVSIYENVRKR